MENFLFEHNGALYYMFTVSLRYICGFMGGKWLWRNICLSKAKTHCIKLQKFRNLWFIIMKSLQLHQWYFEASAPFSAFTGCHRTRVVCFLLPPAAASFPLDRMYGDNFCSMGLLSSTTKNAHLPQMKAYPNLSRVWKLCSLNLCDQIRWWETRFEGPWFYPVCGYAKDIMDLLPPNNSWNSMCPANFPTEMFPGKNTRNMHMSESSGTHLNHITKNPSLDGSLYFPKQSWKIALNSIPPKTVSDYIYEQLYGLPISKRQQKDFGIKSSKSFTVRKLCPARRSMIHLWVAVGWCFWQKLTFWWYVYVSYIFLYTPIIYPFLARTHTHIYMYIL